MIDELDYIRRFRNEPYEPTREVLDNAREQLAEVMLREELGEGAIPQPVREHRSRPRLGRRARRVAIGAAVALVIGVVATVAPFQSGPSRNAAATVLNQLADTAAHQSAVGAGQYVYTEVRTAVATDGEGFGTQGKSFYWYLSGTVQTWVNSQGAGRRVVTADPTPQFFTQHDRQEWIAAGSPILADPSNMTNYTQILVPAASVAPSPAGSRPTQTVGPIADPTDPPFDVSSLPTDPAVLLRELQEGTTGNAQIDAIAPPYSIDGTCQSTSCETFFRAARLLEGPDSGATPALRSALFQILAGVPGVQLLGTVTDRDGQSGLGITYVQHGAGPQTPARCVGGPPGMTSSSPPAVSTTFEIIFNSATTSVVGTSESYSPSTISGDYLCGHPGGQIRLTPLWSDVITSGIVSSDTSTSSS
jgi:hypothetical protein